MAGVAHGAMEVAVVPEEKPKGVGTLDKIDRVAIKTQRV